MFLAHDASITGNGRTGFAITENGIYYRRTGQENIVRITYQELAMEEKATPLNYSEILIGKHRIWCGGAVDRAQSEFTKLFNEIQSVLQKEMGPIQSLRRFGHHAVRAMKTAVPKLRQVQINLPRIAFQRSKG